MHSIQNQCPSGQLYDQHRALNECVQCNSIQNWSPSWHLHAQQRDINKCKVNSQTKYEFFILIQTLQIVCQHFIAKSGSFFVLISSFIFKHYTLCMLQVNNRVSNIEQLLCYCSRIFLNDFLFFSIDIAIKGEGIINTFVLFYNFYLFKQEIQVNI